MNGELIPLTFAIACIGVVFGIRVIRILTVHQQKMAEILRANSLPAHQDQQLAAQIADLRQLVVQQSLAIEQLRSERIAAQSTPIQDRLSV